MTNSPDGPTATITHQGCPLHYKITGTVGPRVLFIQGTGIHGDGWLPQTRALSDRFQCLTFDNRGMGQSQPRGTPPLTVEQMAEDARVILDHAGWDEAHVVGHSLGGLIALQLALTHRTRVSSLALLCTFADGKVATSMTWPKFWLGLRSYLGTRAMRRRAFLQMVMPADHLRTVPDPDALAVSLAPFFGHDLADHPPVEMKQLLAMGHCDLTPRLPELNGLPTLVVTAAHDLIARTEPGRQIAATIKGALHRELSDAAHGAPIQCADTVNAWLEEFWQICHLHS